MKVVCTKSFVIDKYDDNGFWTVEQLCIEQGTIFEVSKDKYRLVGDNDTVRLDNENIWLETSKETFNEHFKENSNEI